MGCTHCGESSVEGTHRLVFDRADKELELTLCDGCLDELLVENDIRLRDR